MYVSFTNSSSLFKCFNQAFRIQGPLTFPPQLPPASQDYTTARPSVKASVLEDFDISWCRGDFFWARLLLERGDVYI